MNRNKWFAVAACVLSLLPSCVKDDYEDRSTGGPAEVRLLINGGSTRTRAGSTDTDNAIRQVRIYAFNANEEKVGYAYAPDLNSDGTTYVPVSLTEIGAINFYVIANDGFATGATVDGTPVTNWEELTLGQLQELYFTGMCEVEGKFISPMANNPVNPGGSDDSDGTKNNYSQPVNIDGNRNEPQIVQVDVQHILSRLRLLLNKEGNAEVTVNSATIKHGPQNYLLYSETDDNATVQNEQRKEETFITNQPVTQLFTSKGVYPDACEIGRTYITPNPEGSTDPDEFNGSDQEKAYILSITYTVEGEEKTTKDVYLPPVRRNQSIDVQGTLKGGALYATWEVSNWDDQEIYYEMSNKGDFKIQGMTVRKSDGKLATVYSQSAGAANEQLTFTVQMTSPKGVRWIAHLTNPADFEFAGAYQGVGDGDPVTVTVRPTKSAATMTTGRETRLYFTIDTQQGTKQSFNASSLGLGDDETEIPIVQVTSAEWKKLDPVTPVTEE